MFKTLMITTAMSGLMIGAAAAQSYSPPAADQKPMNSPTTAQSSPSGSAGSANIIGAQGTDQWLSSKFVGTDVIGTDDKKIGDVSDVLINEKGEVVAYVVGVGGFLGIGQKDVALAPSSFQVVAGQNRNDTKLRLSMSKDQLTQAASFEPYRPPATTTGSSTNTGPAGMARPGAGAPAVNR